MFKKIMNKVYKPNSNLNTSNGPNVANKHVIEQLGSAKTLPAMLNEIFLELSMNLSVLYLAMLFKECQDSIRIILWLNLSPVDNVPKVFRHIPLVFIYHVMQYDATSHVLT